MRASVRGASRPGRIVRTTDFRTEVLGQIARSKTATTKIATTRVIVTIATDATVVLRDLPALSRSSGRRVKLAPMLRQRRPPGFHLS